MSNASYKDLLDLKELKTTYFLENVKKIQFALFCYYLYLPIETYKVDFSFAIDHRKRRPYVAVSNCTFCYTKATFLLGGNFV